MNFAFLDPWHLFVPREGGHVVGFQGAAGRAGLMAAFADVCADAGVPVALTRTVAGAVLPAAPAVAWDALAAGTPGTAGPRLAVVGAADDPLAPLDAARVDDLGGLLPGHVVLVAVDGPCAEPLRILPAAEPVWPGRTSLAVLDVGVDAVGGRIDRRLRAWDLRPVSPLADLPGHELLTWDHLERLLLAESGGLGRLPAGVPAVLALNGLAEQDDSIGLFAFCDRIMAHPALPLAVFTTATEAGLEVRAACRPDGPDTA